MAVTNKVRLNLLMLPKPKFTIQIGILTGNDLIFRICDKKRSFFARQHATEVITLTCNWLGGIFVCLATGSRAQASSWPPCISWAIL